MSRTTGRAISANIRAGLLLAGVLLACATLSPGIAGEGATLNDRLSIATRVTADVASADGVPTDPPAVAQTSEPAAAPDTATPKRAATSDAATPRPSATVSLVRPATETAAVQSGSPSRSPRSYAVVGDSLSVWAFPSQGGPPSTTSAWPAVLDKLDPALVLIRNAAVPGLTTDKMVTRLRTSVLPVHPDVLFVLGGTNDVGSGWAVSTTVANLRAIVRAAKSRGIEVVLLTIPPSNVFSKAELRRLRQTNAALKRMAAEERVRVVDVYAALATAGGKMPQIYEAADRLHLTIRGEQAVAQLVYGAMLAAGPETAQAR